MGEQGSPFSYGCSFAAGLSGLPGRRRRFGEFELPGDGITGVGWSSPRNCRAAFSGSMPGIGVAPGFANWIAFAGSGGAVFELAFLEEIFAFPGAGIPGVEFAVGAIGLADSPGGSAFVFEFVFAGFTDTVFPFAFEALEFVSPPPQAAPETAATARIIESFFINASSCI